MPNEKRKITHNKTTLAVNIDKGLMKQLDEYAKGLHITKTAAVAVLLTTALEAKRNMRTIETLLTEYKASKDVKTAGKALEKAKENKEG